MRAEMHAFAKEDEEEDKTWTRRFVESYLSKVGWNLERASDRTTIVSSISGHSENGWLPLFFTHSFVFCYPVPVVLSNERQ